MIVSFLPEPPQPEDRLRRSIKNFLRGLGLEESAQSMLWVDEGVLSKRRMGEIAGRVRDTVILAFLETFPFEHNGKAGAFLCQHGKRVQDYIDGELRRVVSDAVMAGEKDQ